MNTQPARGMRDFLPADVRRREYVIGVIKEVYERYGFEPLETPAVENIETLMGKYGDEGNQLIFKILKRGVHEKSGEADLALRYDLTVPLARVVAQYKNELPKFFKRYQIQPVWRADRPGRGRFREFYQCDVDVLDSHSMVVEAELCAAVSDVLIQLKFNDFTIRLNHRQVLSGILDVAGVLQEKHAEALITLDKWDKIGVEGIQKELRSRDITESAIEQLVKIYQFTANTFNTVDVDGASWNDMVFGFLSHFLEGHSEGLGGLGELREVLEYSSMTSAGSRVQLDPSLARGLSYYTGPIMEVSVRDLTGSLGGGGRYDNLVGMFCGQNVPACGFSLGLERIIVVMTEREMFPPNVASSPADVMVAIWYHKEPEKKMEAAQDSLRIARVLRSAGIRVDVYPLRNSKIELQIRYASNRSIPFVVIIGADEKERGEVKLKDMHSRKERSVASGDLVTAVIEALANA
jgi:histidyl-tRNA synthetase